MKTLAMLNATLIALSLSLTVNASEDVSPILCESGDWLVLEYPTCEDTSNPMSLEGTDAEICGTTGEMVADKSCPAIAWEACRDESHDVDFNAPVRLAATSPMYTQEIPGGTGKSREYHCQKLIDNHAKSKGKNFRFKLMGTSESKIIKGIRTKYVYQCDVQEIEYEFALTESPACKPVARQACKAVAKTCTDPEIGRKQKLYNLKTSPSCLSPQHEAVIIEGNQFIAESTKAYKEALTHADKALGEKAPIRQTVLDGSIDLQEIADEGKAAIVACSSCENAAAGLDSDDDAVSAEAAQNSLACIQNLFKGKLVNRTGSDLSDSAKLSLIGIINSIQDIDAIEGLLSDDESRFLETVSGNLSK